MSDNKPESVGVKIPFNTYDIFGYFVPGLTLFVSAFLFEHRLNVDHTSNGIHLPCLHFLQAAIGYDTQQHIAIGVFLLVSAVCLLYVCGHIIASFSSIVIDRIFVCKGYGYPYESLLLPMPRPRRRATQEQQVAETSFVMRVLRKWFPKRRPTTQGMRITKAKAACRRYYHGLYFWLNAIVIVLYFNFCFSSNNLMFVVHQLLSKVKSVGRELAYGNFMFLCNFAKWRSVWKLLVPDYVNLAIACILIIICIFALLKMHQFNDERIISSAIRNGWRYKMFRKLMRGYACLYIILERMHSNFVVSGTSFGRYFLLRYRDYFTKTFKQRPALAGTNNYWLCFCYVTDKSPRLTTLVSNWFNLYSHARNIAMALYLSAIYCGFSLCYQKHAIDPSNWHVCILFPMAYWLSSMILLSRYYYLYHSYYSKFIFRTFVYLNDAQASRVPAASATPVI